MFIVTASNYEKSDGFNETSFIFRNYYPADCLQNM